MENPPTSNPATTDWAVSRGKNCVLENICLPSILSLQNLEFKLKKCRKWLCLRPWAIADEDALPDGESAVVPHQQEVEEGIQHPTK